MCRFGYRRSFRVVEIRRMVGDPGLEPGWVTPHAPQTCASTSSASRPAAPVILPGGRFLRHREQRREIADDRQLPSRCDCASPGRCRAQDFASRHDKSCSVRSQGWPATPRHHNPQRRRRSLVPAPLATSGGDGAINSAISGARRDTQAAGTGRDRGTGGVADGSGESRWSWSALTCCCRTLVC